jgi:hypothetical protein
MARHLLALLVLLLVGPVTTGTASGSSTLRPETRVRGLDEHPALRIEPIEQLRKESIERTHASMLKVTVGCALAAGGGGTTTLFRAVKDGELADIEATGAFRTPAGMAEGKYFSTTAEGAATYGKEAYGAWPHEGPYTLIRTEAPTGLLGPVFGVEKGIPSVLIPNEVLPVLRPQVMPSMPVPR